MADDRCGTVFAGDVYNNTPYNMTVVGDHTSGSVFTVVLRSYQRASSRGICDADFFTMPVNGTVFGTYRAKGTQIKIGVNKITCRKVPPADLDYIQCT